jgi:hypothetical protein
MLLGTAAVGLVATLLTLPAPTPTVCVTRCAMRASAKASVCRAILVYTCARETIATGTRETVTIITNIPDQV